MKISLKTMLSVRGAAGAILVAGVSTGHGSASDAMSRGVVMQATGKKSADAQMSQDTEKKEEKKEKDKDPCLACGRG